jgi:aminoglycoside phosphotransferase (APT) family kinase protein
MTDLHVHPTDAEGITPDYLDGLLAEESGGRVTDVSIVEARTYGEQMVSTAGRVVVDVTYAAGAAVDLPTRLVVKLARGIDGIMAPFYANEVAFYRRIRPELEIEAPRCFGGDFDGPSGRFALLLEDLTVRGATFPNVTQPTTPDQIRALLDTLAALHACFWQTPRFATDLAWVETHVAGSVHDMMNNLAPAYIQHEIDHENFKREMVQRLRTTGDELLAGVQAVQRHQSRLPQTLLHGDTHLGNTYFLPDGSGGLLDWQLMVRGYAMHDVNYLITTGLSIGDRRAHERDLLAYYLDRLASAGAAAPNFEDAWLDYRRALVWGVYVGWLTTPVVNYGWEINVLNHLRLTTAFEDHDTASLVAKLS